MSALPSETNKHIEPVFTLTGQTIEALRDLGDVLQEVHHRLLAEGYILKDSKYVKAHQD